MAILHWFLFLIATTTTATSYSSDYDYIIVGGGTAGLTVANRLSEDPSVSILVIEPGQAEFNNPDVTDISRLAYTYDSPIDWAYETTNQSFGGRRQIMRAGKALGGTSVMNGAAYVRAENIQLDALRAFKIADWTWESLFPYYLKSEALRTPNKTQVDAGAPVIPSYHGHDGPVQVGFTDIRKQENDLPSVLNRTLASMGVPWNRDLNSGVMRGFSMHPYTVDGGNVRSDAATAYYRPAEKRENLEIMFNASVERVLWDERVGGQEGGLVAKGVEVYGADRDGRKQVVNARREVILAAGAMKSSAVLELSGVGNPRVLQKHGIPVQINLPSVGENLQDQLNTSFVLTTKVPITGTRTVAFVSASDLFGSSTESIAASIHAQIPEYAEATANETNGAMTKESLQRLFESQHDLMFNRGIPVGEFVFILDGPSQLHVGYWGLLPFSRGNVHIASRDPRTPPTVNPNYGMLGWDTQVQIAMSKFLRRMFQTGELGQLIDTEKVPGLDLIPDDASDETWMEWIGEQYTPNYHAIGTTSMLPREMGGVLDTRLKVYGTRNVRVVDSSVFPVQLCGHPTANIYAVGEWVADIIKEDGLERRRDGRV